MFCYREGTSYTFEILESCKTVNKIPIVKDLIKKNTFALTLVLWAVPVLWFLVFMHRHYLQYWRVFFLLFWLYVLRKEGRRGLTSIENIIDALILGLEEYTKNEQRKTYYSGQKNIDGIMINRTTTRKQKWEEKQVYGYFKRQTSEISHKKA